MSMVVLLIITLMGAIQPLYADLKGVIQKEQGLQVNFFAPPSLVEKQPQTTIVHVQLAIENSNNHHLKKGLLTPAYDLYNRVIAQRIQYVMLERENLGTPLVSPHQLTRAEFFQTALMFSHPPKNQPDQLRPSSHFMNFSIMASLILVAIFLILLREKPHLPLSYINFFSPYLTRDRDDTQMGNTGFTRFNLFHYLFNSLLAALVMLAILHFATDEVTVANYFLAGSVLEDFYQWARLSGLMMGILTSKFIITWVLSILFGNKEGAHIQLYNYLIFLSFVFGLAGTICLMYFIFGVTNNGQLYIFLIYGVVFALIFWVIIIGIKLLNQSAYSFSYLFFYLCASELIPAVIIVRMLTFQTI